MLRVLRVLCCVARGGRRKTREDMLAGVGGMGMVWGKCVRACGVCVREDPADEDAFAHISIAVACTTCVHVEPGPSSPNQLVLFVSWQFG